MAFQPVFRPWPLQSSLPLAAAFWFFVWNKSTVSFQTSRSHLYLSFPIRIFLPEYPLYFGGQEGDISLLFWLAHCSVFMFKLSREPCRNAVCKYPLFRLSTHPWLVQAWKSYQAIHILQKLAVIGVHQAVLLWMLQVVLNCSQKKWILKIQLFDACH